MTVIFSIFGTLYFVIGYLIVLMHHDNYSNNLKSIIAGVLWPLTLLFEWVNE